MAVRVKILALCFCICLFLNACITEAPIPDISFKRPPTAEKNNLKAALIISESLKNAVHENTIYSSCGYPMPDNKYIYRFFEKKKEGEMRIEIKTGKTIEELFSRGLAFLFDKVDIYGNIAEIKNKNDYDYILIPYAEIETAYDKEGALRRKIEPVYYLPNDHLGRIDGAKGSPLRISSSVELKLTIKDIKTGKAVEIFTGIGSSNSTTVEARCGSGGEYRPDLKNYNLSNDYGKPIGKAMSQAFEELLKELNLALPPLAKAKSEEKALPSDLALNVRFSDSTGFFPNNSLDAGENAEIIVTVKNTGKGSGYGTNLEIASENPKIVFDKNINVGDIQPNETKEIKIPLKAGLDMTDGKASFQFSLKEKRGYDARKVAVYIPTVKLERPQLEIISTEINDSDTGLAKGNGNGIPESGETIELTAFIKNNGVGKAIGVNLNGVDMTSGIEWVRNSILVGTIQPGDIAKAKIAFTIPRNFDAKDIAANLNVADSRGVSNADKKIALSYAKQSPGIQYAYRIYSKGNPVSTITNGEEYEIELTINNKGQIQARNVVVTINPPIPPLSKGGKGGLNLSRSRIDLGEIKENASISGQRFTLSVPRTFVETQAVLNLKISQSDFSSAESSIQIPVDVKSPKLKYTAGVQGGGNRIEKGSSAVLEINVINEGNLPADGVRLKIESRDKEALNIIGRTEETIGKIPAGSKSEIIKFQLSTRRGKIRLGDNYLDITITQNDFQSISSQYALNVVEEGMSVVDIGTEDSGKMQTTKVQAGGPVITLKTPQNSETTTDETIRLAFEVSDSRNIDSIKVTVNGKVELTERPASSKKGIAREIGLQEGQNSIAIIAYNSANIPSRKEIAVTRIAEDDVDSPPVTGINNPDALAVVIGISKYENRDISSVDYAKKDAMTVKEYLVKTLGFKESNIKEFYDEQATSKKLESYFKTHLKNRVRSGISDIFIFYSGHGVPEGNEAYLVPYDLDPDDIKTTGYAVKELYKQMEGIKAKSVTIVIDACFSGRSEGDKPVIKSASPLVLDIPNTLLKIKNGVVLTASSGKQIASWYEKKQHGLFTYYFLRGLKGRADADNNGAITAGELGQYLNKNISEQARVLFNREQTPEVMGNMETVLVRLK